MNKKQKTKRAEAFCITVISIFLLLLMKILYQPETEQKDTPSVHWCSCWYQIRDGEKDHPGASMPGSDRADGKQSHYATFAVT